VGTQTLFVTFTPADTANYTGASASVLLTVDKATPTITWADPSAITYGTPLSDAQLNATADVPGSFAYGPDAGAVLTAGSHSLSVTSPRPDSANYSGVTRPAPLAVGKATLTVTADDASRAYGADTPALTARFSGFVNGEPLPSSGGTGAPGLSTAATA